MKLGDIYKLSIQMGINADPRGRSLPKKDLQKSRQKYDKLSERDKEFFDLESLINPYADTRILLGHKNKEIKKALVGIDIEAGEVACAAALNAQGAGIDLLIAHHPEGQALCALDQVMGLQSDYMISEGVRPALAESLMRERINEVGRSLGRGNAFRAVDAAKFFGFSFMCVHTPADNLVTDYLIKLFKKEQPQELDDMIELLKDIPEYHFAAQNHNPPRIVSGNKSNTVGRFFVDFTGGTSGHKENYEKLAESGINTILAMCVSESQIKLAKDLRINLISAGHMPSDSLGINLYLDQLEVEGLEIIPISGLIRVKRN
ncbi:MAG: NGG1p interacting factor NIF3 [Bacillota bacterium]|jgi:putative NIF3 family GTP cyclohydrolase 1 type 2